ncbi:prolyl 4-hydroxylase subunit alpha-1-like [Ornithodoros turicata]|uniref:prolyl 4-hydroxylase subunit alpha-1-like n=1 Tax=Ornithodoros turicata TaxID=34597 RepID=UPI003139016B
MNGMFPEYLVPIAFYILIQLGRWHGGHCEPTPDLYTSTREQTQLLHTERMVTKALQEYITLEEERLSRFERYSTHLLRDLEGCKILLHNLYGGSRPEISSRNVDNLGVTVSGSVFPTRTDLEGAAIGLCRLQKIYHLNVSSLIEMRSPLLPPPTSNEMTEIAYMCLIKDYKTPIDWVQEAMKVARNSSSAKHSFNDIMALSLLNRKQISSAMAFARQVIRYPPESVNVSATFSQWKTNSSAKKDPPEPVSPMEVDAYYFANTCLQREDSSRRRSSKLTCRMTTASGNPAMLLQPVKVEVLSADPIIILYHDLLSREECESMCDVTKNKLRRTTTEPLPAYRVGKLLWLDDGDDALAARVSRRISAVTGLSINNAEPLQIVNYGLGGHYGPHNDNGNPGDALEDYTVQNGFRIATALLYLSDVAAGGSTVFPKLDIEVRPKAGLALFWFNMKTAGESETDYVRTWSETRTRDMRTLHGSCPVLRGSKWIATKWIRERGQYKVNYQLPLHG